MLPKAVQIISSEKRDVEVIAGICGYLTKPQSRKCSWVSQGRGSKYWKLHKQGRSSPSPPLSGCVPLSPFSVAFVILSLQTIPCFSMNKAGHGHHPLLHPVQATPGGWLAPLNPNSEFPEEGKRPAQLGLTVSEVWTVRSDFLLKRIAWIGVGRVNKSDKCYLCQVTKVNIKSQVMLMICILDVMKTTPHLRGLLPKTYNLSLILTKTSDKFQLPD